MIGTPRPSSPGYIGAQNGGRMSVRSLALLTSLVLAGCYPEVPFKFEAEEGLDGEDGGLDGTDGTDGTDGSAGDCAWYQDVDGDGFGAGEVVAVDCENQPEGTVDNALDCDDSLAYTNPDAGERCDELDNDCDEVVDEDLVYLWYADNDSDLYGDPTLSFETCMPPDTAVEDNTDCNDREPTIHPGASEVCSGTDEDCDGLIDGSDPDLDLSTATTYYGDADADGFGDAATPILACEPEDGTSTNSLDCDDTRDDIHPDAQEICSGTDEDCDSLIDDSDPDLDPSGGIPAWVDADGDSFGDDERPVEICALTTGFSATPGDCDDLDPQVSPAGQEVCAAGDEDCDGQEGDADRSVDPAGFTQWYPDLDGDSYGNPSGGLSACDAPADHVSNNTDCADDDSLINPAAVEVCSGIDEDCDGQIDDSDPDVDLPGGSTYYLDVDGDTYGDPASGSLACTMPAGRTSNATDCDDSLATINPLAIEECDTVDNDCDGLVDDADRSLAGSTTISSYTDADRDGYGTGLPRIACSLSTGEAGVGGDCNDASMGINPGATEVCNGVDDDCDLSVDGADPSIDTATYSTFYRDSDLDGFGTTSATSLACSASEGWSALSTDCNDGAVDISPSAAEVCDGRDNDCDALTDGADPSLDPTSLSEWWIDSDGDDLGAEGSASTWACEEPSGYANNDLDCDDTGFEDEDSDGAQDCEDEDIDGDGLRNTWDADPYDSDIARGPTGGFGTLGPVAFSGSLAWSVVNTRLSANAAEGATSLTVADGSLFVEGDEILIIDQQGSGAGARTFAFVAASSGGGLVIEPPLPQAFNASDVVRIYVVPHFGAVTLSGSLAAPAWSGTGGGVLVARASGAVTISGSISASSAGYRGGAGVSGNGSSPSQGESYLDTGVAGTRTANEGGGGADSPDNNRGAGGGGGSYGGSGTGGVRLSGSARTSAGATYGATGLSTWFMGSGGGGGQPDSESDGGYTSNLTGTGGAGGGLIALYSATSITVSGTVSANGEAGEAGYWGSTDWWAQGEIGGGGGGSGGQILLIAPSISVGSSLVTATGGAGGNGRTNSYPYTPLTGGAGGTGLIRLEGTVSGYT